MLFNSMKFIVQLLFWGHCMHHLMFHFVYKHTLDITFIENKQKVFTDRAITFSTTMPRLALWGFTRYSLLRKSLGKTNDQHLASILDVQYLSTSRTRKERSREDEGTATQTQTSPRSNREHLYTALTYHVKKRKHETPIQTESSKQRKRRMER